MVQSGSASGGNGPVTSATGSADDRDPLQSLDRSLCEFETFEYLPEERAYRATFDASRRSASTAVISALAVVHDIDPLDLEPLGRSVDTAALDRLLDPDWLAGSDVAVTFSTSGFEVEIDRSGELAIRPTGDAAE